MLYEAVCLVAHCSFRVPDQRFPVFSPGKACHEIDLAVKEHLVEVTEFTIHIFVMPAGIFGKLLIVLVGIACLYEIG